MPAWRWDGEDLILELRVTPRSARDRLEGEHDGRLRLRITAPPVDGKANRHLLGVLAALFGVPRRDIKLIRGETGRNKTVRIHSPCKLPAPVTRKN